MKQARFLFGSSCGKERDREREREGGGGEKGGEGREGLCDS